MLEKTKYTEEEKRRRYRKRKKERLKKKIKYKIANVFKKSISKIVSFIGSAVLSFIGAIAPYILVLGILLTIIGGSLNATLPVTELGLETLTFTGGGGTTMSTSSIKAEAGDRYKWDETAKVESLTDNYSKNLYRYCKLFYEELEEQGYSKDVRMDGLVAIGGVETGLRFYKNESKGNVLTDVGDYNTGASCQGTLAIDTRYIAGGKNPNFLPDAIEHTVSDTYTIYKNIQTISNDTRGHKYGKYLKKAFDDYGLNWEADNQARTTICALLYYYRHAGGNWNTDWAEAMADCVVWMYVNFFEGGNLSLLEIYEENVSLIDSYHIQGAAIGTNKVYGFEMNQSNLKNVMGKRRGTGTLSPIYKYKGKPMEDAFYAYYFFKAPRGNETLQVFNKYAKETQSDWVNGCRSQAVMALGVGFGYPTLGQYYMLKAVESLGYNKEDFTFDDLGYLCYKGTSKNTEGGTTATQGEVLLNEETIEVLSAVINAEAGGCGYYADYTAEELANCEAVAIVMRNSTQRDYLSDCSGDMDRAVLKMLIRPNGYSTVTKGTGGKKDFTVDGVAYTVKNGVPNDPKSVLAVKNIFNDNGDIQKKAFENVQKYMKAQGGGKVDMSNLKKAYGFRQAPAYHNFGTPLGLLANTYIYLKELTPTWWKF